MKISEYNDHVFRTYQAIYNGNRDSWTSQVGMREVANIILKTESLPIQSMFEIGGGRGLDAAKMIDHVKSYIVVEPVDTNEMRLLTASCAEKIQWIKYRFPLDNITFDPFSVILDNGCFHHEHPDAQSTYFESINNLSDENTSLYMSLFGSKDHEKTSSIRTMPDGRYASIIHLDDCVSFFNQFNWNIDCHWVISNGHDKRPYNLLKLKRKG